MKTLRTSLSLILCACLIAGCAGLDATLSTAEAIVNSAAAILTPVNPQDGAALSAIGKGLTDIDAAYNDYEKAEATLKPGKAAALQAAITATQDNLSVLLADVRVKNPQLVTEITVAVAIANSVLVAILSHLPAPSSVAVNVPNGPGRIQIARPSLPTVKAKNASDLKKAWNAAVGASHPEAMVK